MITISITILHLILHLLRRFLSERLYPSSFHPLFHLIPISSPSMLFINHSFNTIVPYPFLYQFPLPVNHSPLFCSLLLFSPVPSPSSILRVCCSASSPILPSLHPSLSYISLASAYFTTKPSLILPFPTFPSSSLIHYSLPPSLRFLTCKSFFLLFFFHFFISFIHSPFHCLLPLYSSSSSALPSQ